MNFSLNTFLVSISGLPFVFTKVRTLLSVCKLNNSTRMWDLISWRRSLSYRSQSIDLQSKSKDWFLYDRELSHKRLKHRALSCIMVIKRGKDCRLLLWISYDLHKYVSHA